MLFFYQLVSLLFSYLLTNHYSILHVPLTCSRILEIFGVQELANPEDAGRKSYSTVGAAFMHFMQ